MRAAFQPFCLCAGDCAAAVPALCFVPSSGGAARAAFPAAEAAEPALVLSADSERTIRMFSRQTHLRVIKCTLLLLLQCARQRCGKRRKHWSAARARRSCSPPGMSSGLARPAWPTAPLLLRTRGPPALSLSLSLALSLVPVGTAVPGGAPLQAVRSPQTSPLPLFIGVPEVLTQTHDCGHRKG